MRKLIFAAILLLAAGCATSSPAPTANSIPCAAVDPVTPTAAEWAALSETTAAQIENLLAAGEIACGW